MPNVDLSMLVTPELREKARSSERRGAAKDACRARIHAVADQVAQLNLSAAVAAGLLPGADLETYRAGLGWIAAMRAASSAIGSDARLDPGDDANWPAVPPGVAELAARF